MTLAVSWVRGAIAASFPKIKRHLVPVASQIGFFFVVQAVQLECRPVAGLYVAFRRRRYQLGS
jgi:hypothetical protein